MALPTPIYDLWQFPDVYEPSQDSHLFLDALEKDREEIVSRHPTLALEIGSGSGILITALGTILQSSCACFSTDINFSACQATKKTSLLNKVSIESLAMNLTDMFKCCFDVVLFNPPYVVTESGEVSGRGLNRAFAGGLKGRLIIDKFLEVVPKVLSEKGVCYLLLLKENDIKEVVKNLEKAGLKGELVIQRKLPGEHLFVYKFCR
ncbi:methyltransferase N6AMT1 [Euwallacea fornicatus]|uniref:methyltransferase N6AMT1 n=1 Tax=Euwallacea fornicatus TaxID=995702 RepID=UPI00338F4919